MVHAHEGFHLTTWLDVLSGLFTLWLIDIFLCLLLGLLHLLLKLHFLVFGDIT